MNDAVPAATLVIFREVANGGMPELLMVERSRILAFAGGALVFPGGRVEPGDQQLAATLPGDPDETAARIAAVRETIEEVGLGIGLMNAEPAAVAAIRRQLLSGVPLGPALANARAALDLTKLQPFARWRPDLPHDRVFDTRFYIANLPAGADTAEVDATENVSLWWASAETVLAAADAERAVLIYPTRRNLERLARFRNFADAAADAASRAIDTITPWVEVRNGEPHLCIPNDQGYPVTAEPLATARRG